MSIKMENVLKIDNEDIDINEIVDKNKVQYFSHLSDEDFKNISVAYIGAYIDDYDDCRMRFDVTYKGKTEVYDENIQLITTLSKEKLTTLLSKLKGTLPRESEIHGIRDCLIWQHFNGKGDEKLGQFFIDIFSKNKATNIEAQIPKIPPKAKAKTRKKSNDFELGM